MIQSPFFMATSLKWEKLVLQGVLLFYNKTLLSYLIKINKSALCSELL